MALPLCPAVAFGAARYLIFLSNAGSRLTECSDFRQPGCHSHIRKRGGVSTIPSRWQETNGSLPAPSLADIQQKACKLALFRAVYSSRPFGFDTAILNGILVDARRANERDGITGALICRNDIYLQWLEGPQEQVKDALARIRRDDRHLEVILHVAEPASERVFDKWAMLHDPAATWIWSQEEVAKGSTRTSTPDEVKGFFTRLRAQNDGSSAQ